MGKSGSYRELIFAIDGSRMHVVNRAEHMMLVYMGGYRVKDVWGGYHDWQYLQYYLI